MPQDFPYYLAGKPVHKSDWLSITDKFTGAEAFRVRKADRPAIETAIASAVAAAPALRHLPTAERRSILLHVHRRLVDRTEDFAQVMCVEAGKPIKDARAEVARAIDTFQLAADEAIRLDDERIPLDLTARGKGYEGTLRRVPIGPCSFITPFNFPLNLVAHKAAPAIAAGCPFILKPAPQAPICAILLAELLAETALPAGTFSVVPCDVDVAVPLVEDDRIKLLSFTGSAAVGWMLKLRAGKKKVVLELGGNAACIVDQDADLDRAIPRIAFGAFAYAGQSCISVQRLIVHKSITRVVVDRLIKEAAALRFGNPREESTTLAPLISEQDAVRIHEWVHEAVHAGGKLLCGGKRIGTVGYEPTIVENVPETSRLWTEEVFGPVLTIHSFDRFESACEMINRSRYGLQAGVITNSPQHIEFSWNELEVGGVIINDVPTLRFDNMPYGGVKDSGCGREGVRYAMEEMSEMRVMVRRM